MKKILIVLFTFLMVAGAISALDLDSFPKGSWVDEKYNAVWTFSQDNLVLSYTNGEVVFDFRGKIENLLVTPGTKGLEVSFKCEETGRSYKFVKNTNVMDTSIKMIIDKTNGLHYEVDMPLKK